MGLITNHEIQAFVMLKTLETGNLNHWVLCSPYFADWLCIVLSRWAYTVAQLDEALCYKPKDCAFGSRCCHLDSSFIDLIPPAALWPWSRLILQQGWVPGIFAGAKGGRCVGHDTLTTFICRLSRNPGNVNLLEPEDSVQGKLYRQYVHSVNITAIFLFVWRIWRYFIPNELLYSF